MSKRKLRNLFDLDGYSSILGQNIKESKSNQDRFNSNYKDIFEIIYYLTDSMISINDLITFQSNIGQFLLDEKFDEKFELSFLYK
jgi:hypothetical protein